MSNVLVDGNGKLIIEDARILYRNFSGVGSSYNREGDRNFNVIIDNPDDAAMLQDAGWNIKCRVPRDPDELPLHHMKVNVNFKSLRGPKIYLHTGSNVVLVDETTVADLDQDDILSCDMIISPYHYERNNGSGISAYLDTLHVVVKEDPFAHKYANLEG